MQNQSIVYNVPLRATGTAYLWWFFLGGIGAHKFYLGKPFMGIAYTFTFGFLGLGHLYDLFTMSWQVKRANNAIMTGMGFKKPSEMFSKSEDRPQLTDAAMDAMIARYAAEDRASYAESQQTFATATPSAGTRASFGKRR